MKYNIYLSTHSGKVRRNNEDNFCINDVVRGMDQEEVNLRGFDISGPIVCSVFDGMGGEANGEIASKICADEAVSLYVKRIKTGELFDEDIDAYVKTANDRIVEVIANNKAKRGGSTFAMVYIDEAKVNVYSLGDSRVYLYNGSGVSAITKDHTLAMKKYEANIYTKEEAENSPDSHKLTAFVGVDTDNQGIKAERYNSIDLRKGDKILICSDGLYDMCNEATIAKVLSKNSNTVSFDLVEAALGNGGVDNITCLVIETSDK